MRTLDCRWERVHLLCAWLIVFLGSSVLVGVSVFSFTAYPLPDFTDPKAGFVTTGTSMSNRLHSWLALEKNFRQSLYQVPDNEKARRRGGDPVVVSKNRQVRAIDEIDNDALLEDSRKTLTECRKAWLACDDTELLRLGNIVIRLPGMGDVLSVKSLRWMCTFERALLGILRRQAEEGFIGNWCTNTLNAHSCCDQMMSVSRLATWRNAGISLHGNCSEIDRSALARLERGIEQCRGFGSVIRRCGKQETSSKSNLCWPPDVPKGCRKKKFQILFGYLLQHGILDRNDNSSLTFAHERMEFFFRTSCRDVIGCRAERVICQRAPTQTKPLLNIILPVVRGFAVNELLRNNPDILDLINQAVLTANRQAGLAVEVEAANLGVEHEVFNRKLLSDTKLAVYAVSAILVLSLLYTGSLTYTFLAISGISMSLGVSYFLYVSVFRIDFFPFMNLLVLTLAVGIGADDTLILWHFWQNAKNRDLGDDVLPNVRVRTTLKHAALSMFVTSLTTAVAFFANCLSKVVTVRCFGVFAATTILVNYFVVVIWLMACLVVIENRSWTEFCLCKRSLSFTSTDSTCAYFIAIFASLRANCRKTFETLLPRLILKGRFASLPTLFGLAIASALFIGCQRPYWMPEGPMRLFAGRNPLEGWEQRSLFKDFPGYDVYEEMFYTISVIWGLLPSKVLSERFNPKFSGKSLPLDPDFHMNDSVSILWLQDFCKDLRKQSFFGGGGRRRHSLNCFVERYAEYMDRSCALDLQRSKVKSNAVRGEGCCRDTRFPYDISTNLRCMAAAAQIEQKGASLRQQHLGYSGPVGVFFRRDKIDRKIGRKIDFNQTNDQFDEDDMVHVPGVFVITFATEANFSFNFNKTQSTVRQIDRWMKSKMKSAPGNLRRGFWTAGRDFLGYYDMQKELAQGTLYSVILALSAVFVILLFSTRNLLSAVASAVTIFSIISLTIATLLLLSWKLDVVESTIIILSVGLSFDFTLHYAVAFLQSEHFSNDVEHLDDRLKSAFSKVGSPLFMAFLTSFFAGLAMAPAETMSCHQIGVFVMLIMSVSWVYATFFYIPLFLALDGVWNCNKMRALFPQLGRKKKRSLPHDCSSGTENSTTRTQVGNEEIVFEPERIEGIQTQNVGGSKPQKSGISNQKSPRLLIGRKGKGPSPVKIVKDLLSGRSPQKYDAKNSSELLLTARQGFADVRKFDEFDFIDD